jgi:hypothetical protein
VTTPILELSEFILDFCVVVDLVVRATEIEPSIDTNDAPRIRSYNEPIQVLP